MMMNQEHPTDLELPVTPLPKKKKNFGTSLNMSKHPLPLNLV
jgi:hypothetical protein